MIRQTLFLFATCCALAGCASFDQGNVDEAAVRKSEVPPAVYDRMTRGAPLTVSDIIALSQAGVSEGVILRYFRRSHALYDLSRDDLRRLQRAGVSPNVIDGMQATIRPGWPNAPGGSFIPPLGTPSSGMR